MFRVLRLLAWTSLAVALGVWMATASVGGMTPVARAEQWWHHSSGPAKVEALKTRVSDRIEDAQDALKSARDARTREHHTDKDRETVARLIAKRAAPK
jgi:hypothetical protein